MKHIQHLGAGLMISEIAPYYNWLVEGARDLEIQDFFQHECLDGNWKAKVSEAQAILKNYPGRVGIHGPFWGLDIANPDPLLRQAVKKRLLTGLDITERLEATHMVIHSPIEPWLHRHIQYQQFEKDKVIALMQDTLEDVLTVAQRIGCTLVMENIMDIDPKLQLELIKAMNSESIKMSVDIGHAYCMHKQHGAPPPDQFISQAGDALAHVHLQDTDGYLDRHWIPGQGQINFVAVLEALNMINSDPRLIIEIKDKRRCIKAQETLDGYVEARV
jgi:sugar phosphate isomerase/epimerase